MEWFLVFMAWQKGHCENGYATKATYIFNAILIKMGKFSQRKKNHSQSSYGSTKDLKHTN
jgi:hypothetical protein